MKINYGLVFMILVILALMVLGFALIMQQRTYGRSLDLGMTEPYNGFVVNPYQTGNLDREQSVILLASVSHILKEIKYFIMFIVLWAILAFSACAIIVYFVRNNVSKQIDKPVKIRKDISDGKGENKMTIKEHGDEHGDDGIIPDIHGDKEPDKEPEDYIDKRTARMVLLYISINEMLSDINSVIERSEAGRKHMLS